MALKIRKVSDLQQSPKMRVLVYGGAGTGKTHFACTFPKVAYIRADAGYSTAINSGFDIVDFFEVDQWEDLGDVYKYIKENIGKYETIVLDSLSQLQEKRVREIGKMKGYDAWDSLYQEFRKMTELFEALDTHLVMTVHEAEVTDNKTGTIQKGFALQGSIKEKLAWNFNLIGYVSRSSNEDNEIVHKINFSLDSDQFKTKRQYGKVKDEYVNPTFKMIYPDVLESVKTGKVNEVPVKVKEVLK